MTAKKPKPKRKQKTCTSCFGYHFPHRMGSKGCIFDRNGEYKHQPEPPLPLSTPDEEFPF